MHADASKKAQTDFPILDVIRNRFSPRAYEPKSVPTSDLLSCLEAARWAASSYNEQPWSFIIATRDDPTNFAAMLDCLAEMNRAWAADAGVLLVSVACRTLSRGGSANRMAEHDIGQAVALLSLQATALGLQAHQMAGINLTKIRQVYGIPDTHDPVTAIALGYAGQHDQSPRTRKAASAFTFSGQWQRAADLK